MHSSDRCDHPTNVYEMMERLGLERGGGAIARLGLSYAAAVRVCHQCEWSDACHDWLEVASSTLRAPPKFCPNADLLCELVFDQPCVWRTDVAH